MSTSTFRNHRLVVDDLTDTALAATLLAGGAVVAHGFGNIYALTARGDAASVARVNALKGRPVDQVGSITLPPDRLLSAFDVDALPEPLTPELVGRVVDAFARVGPIGFRGPAASHVPAHLASTANGVLTTQVIVPGTRCPSNRFLTLAAAAVSPVPLFITSANRSRHVTGAADEPAHWRADALRDDLAGAHGLVVLEHADERTARHRYPYHQPMSTTILGLHHVSVVDGVVHLPVERNGSLDVARVRWVLAGLGLGVTVEPSARTRLTAREYGAAPALSS
ncbi:hypothetical protein ICW40_19840 [Actinotalea ferrariae]|uniref:hypothetical protein n=1 Tax=Actinotalea ferrariae TaxID=1386098 RepID=UPI001C8CD6CF|nr:hypothetical protein [Actinotalea ferrariae]MBX9247047.1 hypothetical protein [Actinotalea ferrariae]